MVQFSCEYVEWFMRYGRFSTSTNRAMQLCPFDPYLIRRSWEKNCIILHSFTSRNFETIACLSKQKIPLCSSNHALSHATMKYDFLGLPVFPPESLLGGETGALGSIPARSELVSSVSAPATFTYLLDVFSLSSEVSVCPSSSNKLRLLYLLCL